jgi:hypothetical protein
VGRNVGKMSSNGVKKIPAIGEQWREGTVTNDMRERVFSTTRTQSTSISRMARMKKLIPE